MTPGTKNYIRVCVRRYGGPEVPNTLQLKKKKNPANRKNAAKEHKT